MSNTPLDNDIVLRPIAGDATQCVLVAVNTLEIIIGPLNVVDGTASARSIADRLGVTIWQQQIDDRGRPMGPPLKMYVPVPPV